MPNGTAMSSFAAQYSQKFCEMTVKIVKHAHNATITAPRDMSLRSPTRDPRKP